jgi:hypothetical protein
MSVDAAGLQGKPTLSFRISFGRVLAHYDVGYYNNERVHTPIDDAPNSRAVESRPAKNAKVVGLPRVGGLHHRYRWCEAA